MANDAAGRCGWTNAATGREPGRSSGGWSAAVEASLAGVVGSGLPGGDAGGAVVVEGDPAGEDWGCSEETGGS